MEFWKLLKTKTYFLPFQLINLQSEGYHIQAIVECNDVPFHLLIDTGASKTVLDLNEFQSSFPHLAFTKRDELSTGLGTNSMESSSAILSKFKLGNLLIQNLEIALLDLSHIQNAYRELKLPPIQGVLGNDIWVPFRAIIDYQKNQIRLFE